MTMLLDIISVFLLLKRNMLLHVFEVIDFKQIIDNKEFPEVYT